MVGNQLWRRTMETRKSRIAHLKRLDPDLQVFGARLHRYETYPLSPDDVDQFESALGVTLPEQYRHHLLSVGYGAGPYYGLYSPKIILENLLYEYKELEDDPEDLGPIPSPSIAFLFTRSDAKRIYEARAAGDSCACGAALYPSHGAIPIGTQGCSYDTVLVTAGELRGTVWDLDQEGSCADERDATLQSLFSTRPATWNPSLRASCGLPGVDERLTQRLLSDLPTFDEWFDSWLEAATAGLVNSPTSRNERAQRVWDRARLALRRSSSPGPQGSPRR